MVIEFARTVARSGRCVVVGVRPRHADTRWSRRWTSSSRSSAATATSAARCGSGGTTPCLAPGSLIAEAYGWSPSASDTVTGTRSTTTTGTPLEEAGLAITGGSPDSSLVEFVEPRPRPAPVLRRHPGAPGVQVAAHPRAPAVPGLVGRRAGAAARVTAAGGAGVGEGRLAVTDVVDEPVSLPVTGTRVVHDGRVFDVVPRPSTSARAAPSRASTSSTPARSRSWRSTSRTGC